MKRNANDINIRGSQTVRSTISEGSLIRVKKPPNIENPRLLKDKSLED